MATLKIPDRQVTLTEATEISRYLSPHGIFFEQWETEGRLTEDVASEDILRVFKPEIERLMTAGGYVAADVISVNPSTPGLAEMLAKFDKEHTHSEDEVRFVVAGEGIFHINPLEGDIFSIEMTAGDLINVPAGTKHWFNLCASKTIKTIRLFKDSKGWAPIYVDGGAHVKYEPLCFGQIKGELNTLIEPQIRL